MKIDKQIDVKSIDLPPNLQLDLDEVVKNSGLIDFSIWQQKNENAFQNIYFSGESFSLTHLLGVFEPTNQFVLERIKCGEVLTNQNLSHSKISELKLESTGNTKLINFVLTPLRLCKGKISFALIRKGNEIISSNINEALVVLLKYVEEFNRATDVNTSSLTQSILLNELGDVGNVGAWLYDVNSNFLFWTDKVYDIYCLPRQCKITPDEAINYYQGRSKQLIVESFNEAIKNGKNYDLELKIMDNNNNNKWIRTTGKPIIIEGVVEKVYGSLQDITEYKKLADSEVDNHKYLRSLINNLNDAVVTIDTKGIILECNEAVKKLFYYEVAELKNKNVSILMPEPYKSMHDKYMASYIRTGSAKIIGIGRELPAIRKDNSRFPMELSLSEVIQNNKTVFIGTIRDISDRKIAENKIYRLAYYNQLTGLPNRQSFEKDLEKVTKQLLIAKDELLIALVDIDKFSQVNLSYGKEAGDHVLSLIGQRINSKLPKNFNIYSNSADTFFILSNQANSNLNHKKGYIDSFEPLIALLQDGSITEIPINDTVINLTLSASIISLPPDSFSFSKLIKLLEVSISDIKNRGGNFTKLIGKEDLIQFNRKKLINDEIQKGLIDNEFYIQLQPQYDANFDLVGSEVLLRWSSDVLGVIRPDEFIPIAEETTLIIELGLLVIEQACELLSILNRKKIKHTISINISARQIAQPNFCKLIKDAVKKWEVEPKQLRLEITENLLITDIELVKQRMLELSRSGFSFSIDDFGTGYSSLRYLKELPIKELKIDKYFISEITSAKSKIPIVDAVIEMSKALNLITVAEGVETKAQCNYLFERNCSLIQGYYFSKPLSISDWSELVINNTSLDFS